MKAGQLSSKTPEATIVHMTKTPIPMAICQAERLVVVPNFKRIGRTLSIPQFQKVPRFPMWAVQKVTTFPNWIKMATE